MPSLDCMQSPSVVLPKEQIVDVKLDRGTLFFPLRSGYMPVGTRVLWETQRHTPVENAAAVACPVAGNAKDERKTRNALPKVEILGDVKDAGVLVHSTNAQIRMRNNRGLSTLVGAALSTCTTAHAIVEGAVGIVLVIDAETFGFHFPILRSDLSVWLQETMSGR
ncbi:hypothetical protein B0H10DRAFT_2284706 [Mycena sp. CBHHK59/15]|nr:hypothetical protein B0H10DRAFT_2284706 [Mycena sp. CBHHK59/15]